MQLCGVHVPDIQTWAPHSLLSAMRTGSAAVKELGLEQGHALLGHGEGGSRGRVVGLGRKGLRSPQREGSRQDGGVEEVHAFVRRAHGKGWKLGPSARNRVQ